MANGWNETLPDDLRTGVMTMLESEKLAIAAHLHVLLRRKIGRVTDIEWMVQNNEYASEVIRVANAALEHPELQLWASRLQTALASEPVRSPLEPAPTEPQRAAPAVPPPRYVGSLR
jgi:hypothetical protein